jgi:hypothetical protein
MDWAIKKGAALMRLLYSAFYGGPAETLWPLRNWLGESERGKYPQYTLASALEEDAAERDTARSLKRDRDELHWAWGDGGFFGQRSSMMDTVNCDQTTADLWKYIIDLDADAFPLIFLRPLIVCGVDGDNEFFHLYVLRLDGNEATRREALIATLADGLQSDINFEELILNSNGPSQVKLILSPSQVNSNGSSQVVCGEKTRSPGYTAHPRSLGQLPC